MADQTTTTTIDYTVAATARLPAVTVHLVVTYDDDTQTPLQKREGAYQVTEVSGTYTVGGVSHDITGLKTKHRLGNNDNLIYPGETNIVDKHGITFDYSAPLKGSSAAAMNHVKQVNLFFNPRRGGSLQQFTDYKSRDVVVTTNGEDASSQGTLLGDADCFAGGTLIRTVRGDIAVEALRVGDLAVTATGAVRAIKWLGHRAIDLRRHERAAELSPVRIAAHAFGPGMPARDLCLSPGHPVLVGADADYEGGHLVPVMCLINGTTVRRVSVAHVTYWHVELDGHDILMAEGLPAESYIEFGDRAFFTGAASALANPDLVLPGLDGRCRPVAVDGAIVEAERDRLDMVFATRLGEACDWPTTAAAALDY